MPAATCLPHPPFPTPASSSSSAPDFLWGPRANSWSWLVGSQFQILLASRIWGLVASVQLVPPSSLAPLLFHQPMQINGNFCGLVLNQPLGGLHVIEGLPLLADSSDGMASVAAYTYRQHSVVFIGTRSGSLKKVGCRLGARTYTLKSQTGHCPWGKADFPGRVPGTCSHFMLTNTSAHCGLNGWLTAPDPSQDLPAGRAGPWLSRHCQLLC